MGSFAAATAVACPVEGELNERDASHQGDDREIEEGSRGPREPRRGREAVSQVGGGRPGQGRDQQPKPGHGEVGGEQQTQRGKDQGSCRGAFEYGRYHYSGPGGDSARDGDEPHQLGGVLEMDLTAGNPTQHSHRPGLALPGIPGQDDRGQQDDRHQQGEDDSLVSQGEEEQHQEGNVLPGVNRPNTGGPVPEALNTFPAPLEHIDPAHQIPR